MELTINKSFFSSVLINNSQKQFFCQCVNWFAVALVFFVPISTTITTILTILYLISLCISGRILQVKRYIRNPVVLAILFFILVSFIAAPYSSAPLPDVLRALRLACRLLLIPLLMPVFREYKWQKFGVIALCCAIFISIIASYIKFSHSGNFNDANFFKDRIYTSAFTAFWMFLVSTIMFEEKGSKTMFNLLFFLLALITGGFFLFFVNTGRTGQVLFFVLSMVILYKYVGTRITKIILSSGLLSMLLITLTLVFAPSYLYSQREYARNWLVSHQITVPPVYYRFADGYRECRSYLVNWYSNSKGFPPKSENTSSRLALYLRTLIVSSKNPFFGSGTGSFVTSYNSVFQDRKINGEIVTNPHNQYLLTYTELGIPGLFGFILMLLSLLYLSSKIKRKFNSTILLGLVFFMAIGCTINSWLMDFTSFYFFICLTALTCSYPISFFSRNRSAT